MNGVESLVELQCGRRIEWDSALGKFTLRPLQSLFDRLLVDQERASDLGVAEAAKSVECQGDLIFAGEVRMAAGEDHAQLAVVDLAVVKEFVDAVGALVPALGPFLCKSSPKLVATQCIEDFVFGDTMHPRRRVVGDATGLPRLQCVQ